jgi:PKD repeat protein
MRIIQRPDRRSLAVLFAALSIGLILLSLPLTASAAPTGNNFDHIVIIAMENQDYGSVIGSSSAPFINQLASAGTVLSNYQAYSQNINGCSHGCYEAFTAGNQLLSDGGCPRASSPCSGAPQPDITKQLQTAGLSAALFCEDGCPRGSDHFPWIEYADTWQSCMAVSSGMNCAGTAGPDGALAFNSASSGGNTAFINYLNSANPASYIWFTPTDNHNMHDNSVSSGDSYVQNLLVGTGTLASPSSSSVFGSSLWKAGRTLIYLWWDENSNPPMVLYGPMIKIGYTATETLNEYYMLHMIENNWGLPAIASVVSGDSSPSDIFGSSPPGALSTSFSYSPSRPQPNQTVTFTASATGGSPPYSYGWVFGDGSSATGASTTHTYTRAGTYTVMLNVTDSNGSTTSTTQQVSSSTSSGPVSTPPSTLTFLFIGLIAGGAVGVTAYLAKYYSRNRKVAASLNGARSESSRSK